MLLKDNWFNINQKMRIFKLIKNKKCINKVLLIIMNILSTNYFGMV
jgi:hypothetical protein